MKTKLVKKGDKSTTLFMPEVADVLGLAVGGVAVDCFGRERQVVEVFASGVDINGKAYVCFYTESGPNFRISHTYKADELLRDCRACLLFNSAELDDIERSMS